MKLLEYYNTDPEGQYVDFCTDIVGHPERGIRFVLTYVLKDDRFYASINDTDEHLEETIESIDHDVAKFMLGETEYYKLKQIHTEDSKDKNGQDPTDGLKNAFWEVIRLAKKGQQPWWTEDLKNKSDIAIATLEKYYNEKYGK